MPSNLSKEQLDALDAKAKQAYEDFLDQLKVIDEERKKIFSETIAKMDQAEIDEIKKRLTGKP